ncbi:hypothetical protein V6N13_118314 [Hibiscus sabdariffa]
MDGELKVNKAKTVIELLDSNDDGLLEGGEEEKKKKDLKEVFEMYDADAYRFITPNELKKMLSRLGKWMR